jgi:hypothetical protein
MSEQGPLTGAARDVPPPRPVPVATAPEPGDDGGPLSRAARAVADAVAGLVGGAGGRPTGDGTGEGTGEAADGGAPEGGRRSAAGGLGDVVGAVMGALGAAWGRRDGDPGSAEGSTAGTGRERTGQRSAGAVLGDLLAAAAPRLPIRDRDALRRAFPGASDDEIADALVARAGRLTAAIGAATGGIAAAHWLATPSLLALPLELGAETVLIAGVEVVLLGELHELHGRPAVGDARNRAGTYLASWSEQRAVDQSVATGLGPLLGAAGIRALRRQLTRRMARSVSSAAPFLLGAAIGSRTNRRATEKLAARVRAGLAPGRAPRG